MGFIHCNSCGLTPTIKKSKKYFLTNCGHIFCENCQVRDNCYVCKNKCNMMEISQEMPNDITKLLFGDIIDQMQQTVKGIEFRVDHYDRLQDFADKTLYKYENLKVNYLKLLEELKKAKQEIEWLKRKPEHKPPTVLRNMLKSDIQTRTPFLNPNVVTPPQNLKGSFSPASGPSPARRLEPGRYSVYRRPSPRFTGSSVASDCSTPASVEFTPSPAASDLNRFSSQRRHTDSTPLSTPVSNLRNLQIGSWNGLKPRKPF